ncbi:MAG: hypothetical protein ACYCYA_05465 [Actinomycetes bacterium]
MAQDAPAADGAAPVPDAPMPRPELRRLVLALALLEDLDLTPGPADVRLGADPPVVLTWEHVAEAIGGLDPDSASARTRLAAHVRLIRTTSRLAPDRLFARIRPVGLPVDHILHPGPDWVCQRVRGGVLDLGLGLAVDAVVDPGSSYEWAFGAKASGSPVEILPPALLVQLGGSRPQWWPTARDRLERMGALAIELLVSTPPGRRRDVLTEVGQTDVVTLLGSGAYRGGLAGADGSGMRAAVVPMRNRGWVDLRGIDPVFAPAAASAVEPEDRGFDRPLLITYEEVALARPYRRAQRRRGPRLLPDG